MLFGGPRTARLRGPEESLCHCTNRTGAHWSRGCPAYFHPCPALLCIPRCLSPAGCISQAPGPAGSMGVLEVGGGGQGSSTIPSTAPESQRLHLLRGATSAQTDTWGSSFHQPLQPPGCGVHPSHCPASRGSLLLPVSESPRFPLLGLSDTWSPV